MAGGGGPTIEAWFVPTEDITVYELAIIVKQTMYPSHKVVFSTEQWNELESDLKRHFREVPK